jgi:hypothetical protein
MLISSSGSGTLSSGFGSGKKFFVCKLQYCHKYCHFTYCFMMQFVETKNILPQKSKRFVKVGIRRGTFWKVGFGTGKKSCQVRAVVAKCSSNHAVTCAESGQVTWCFLATWSENYRNKFCLCVDSCPKHVILLKRHSPERDYHFKRQFMSKLGSANMVKCFYSPQRNSTIVWKESVFM